MGKGVLAAPQRLSTSPPRSARALGPGSRPPSRTPTTSYRAHARTREEKNSQRGYSLPPRDDREHGAWLGGASRSRTDSFGCESRTLSPLGRAPARDGSCPERARPSRRRDRVAACSGACPGVSARWQAGPRVSGCPAGGGVVTRRDRRGATRRSRSRRNGCRCRCRRRRGRRVCSWRGGWRRWCCQSDRAH